MSEVKVETVDFENKTYQPKQGEVFFYKVETARRRYIISLRKKGKDEKVIVISEQQFQQQKPEDEGEESKSNRPHKIRIYDEVIDDFIIGLEKLKAKLISLKENEE